MAVIGIQIETELDRQLKDLKGYTDRARSLLFNLKDAKNPQLRQRILEQELTPAYLAKCDIKDLASEAILKERNKTQEDNLNARRSDWLFENVAAKGNKGFFTCRKCQSKNTTYFQMQTRGADEPMTNFITCLDCKNQWKS